jgi:hypothetical protein
MRISEQVIGHYLGLSPVIALLFYKFACIEIYKIIKILSCLKGHGGLDSCRSNYRYSVSSIIYWMYQISNQDSITLRGYTDDLSTKYFL